ncbi:MAG: PD40 domain-containing protein, partial [Caldilineaceae bacterium]|nr:PD40 domain-containing protein [Caldilineaceae bacterium]
NNDWEWDNHPSFSPDGSQIVFMSNRNSGRRQLWIMDADGGNQRQLADFPFEAWDPVWVKYAD